MAEHDAALVEAAVAAYPFGVPPRQKVRAVLDAVAEPLREQGRAQVRAAVEAVLFLACHHCGRLPDFDDDHSCSCPESNSECFQHTEHPVTSLAGIRAALAEAPR